MIKKEKFMIKQEWQEMNNNKQEQEDHLKVLEDKGLEALKVFMVKELKVSKIHLEIFLKNSKNSLVEQVEKEAVQENKHNKQKERMYQLLLKLILWKPLMEFQRLLHLLGMTYVEHVKVQNANQAHLPQVVEVVVVLVSKLLDKGLLPYNKFVEIAMEQVLL